MSRVFYKADSVRVENHGTGAIYGKYQACLREADVRVGQIEDGTWWYDANGVGGAGQESREVAEKCAAAFFIQRGWTTDREAAEVEADRLARERHEAHCLVSGAYKKYYGTATR